MQSRTPKSRNQSEVKTKQGEDNGTGGLRQKHEVNDKGQKEIGETNQDSPGSKHGYRQTNPSSGYGRNHQGRRNHLELEFVNHLTNTGSGRRA